VYDYCNPGGQVERPGAHYAVAAVTSGMVSKCVLNMQTGTYDDVRLTDRERFSFARTCRPAVRVRNPQGGNFQNAVVTGTGMQLLTAGARWMSHSRAELPLHLRASDGGDGSRNSGVAGAGIASTARRGNLPVMIVAISMPIRCIATARWPPTVLRRPFQGCLAGVNPRNRTGG